VLFFSRLSERQDVQAPAATPRLGVAPQAFLPAVAADPGKTDAIPVKDVCE